MGISAQIYFQTDIIITLEYLDEVKPLLWCIYESELVNLIPSLSIVPNNLPSGWSRERSAITCSRTGSKSTSSASRSKDIEDPRPAIFLSLTQLSRNPVLSARKSQSRDSSASSTMCESLAVSERQTNGIDARAAAESEDGCFWRGGESWEVVEP